MVCMTAKPNNVDAPAVLIDLNTPTLSTLNNGCSQLFAKLESVPTKAPVAPPIEIDSYKSILFIPVSKQSHSKINYLTLISFTFSVWVYADYR